MVTKKPRKRRINENAVITLMTPEGSNPKREGSEARRRFDFYRDGMTVREAKAAGLLAIDVAYDEDKGFIKLVDPEGEAAPKKAKKVKAKKKKDGKKAKKAKGKKADTPLEDLAPVE